MNLSTEVTVVDAPPEFIAELDAELGEDQTLAVVSHGLPSPRRTNDLVREVFAGPFAGQLKEHGLSPVFCSPDEAVLRGGRFRSIMLVGESPDDVLPILVRLRSDPQTLLTPILVALRGASRGTHRLIATAWKAYADAVLEGDAALWQPAMALSQLRQIDSRSWLHQPPEDRLPEAQRRQLLVLRWLTTRDLPALEPLRDPSSRGGYSYAPLDLVGPIESDLDALAQAGLLKKAVVDRVSICPHCEDARLLFREVCAACRSADVRRGEVVHHYACGHVQAEGFFRRGEKLICPSCGEGLRHVGIDYERPATLIQCGGCAWVAAEGVTEARCLGCGQLSLAHEVRERAVHRYVLTTVGGEAARRSVLPALPLEG